ncbi:hypothetical protein PRIPAC_88157, partial [Pristionchus pacificus]|uniref:Uncharacterized protein n=1 Tax=Pristionchus pacificus TaxID=54126 RepID=A0A2A6CVK4_PRIPA
MKDQRSGKTFNQSWFQRVLIFFSTCISLIVIPTIEMIPLYSVPKDFFPIIQLVMHIHLSRSLLEAELHLTEFRFALMEEKTILAWIFRHFKIKSSERRFEMRTKMERIMRPQKGRVIVTFRPHLKT